MIKTIILSAGHGKDTKGKRSPDGSLLEWQFNRRLAKRIADKLTEAAIPCICLDMGEADTPLSARAAEANKYGKNCLYISVHGNAAGNGTNWMNARGWSAYTSKGLTQSDEMCEIFMQEADKLLPSIGCKIRKYSSKSTVGKIILLSLLRL